MKLPYDLDCGHCGKHLKGINVPLYCPSCGMFVSHRIGSSKSLYLKDKETWSRCAEPTCRARINVMDYPKMARGDDTVWKYGKKFTGKGKRKNVKRSRTKKAS